ncbi:hypothetical protein L1049_014120 [Liquidambar formosana]|uniref:Uncharacterized protein n=1 Tax=Liquidambar formosana TaxID=63359 RepID=A0AAP0RQE9_LIQFO
MESDLSLIEISGEDDSLLQQIPSDDVSNNYFSCSPLQFLRSERSADSSHITQLGDMKGSKPAEKPRFPSPRDNSNKENTNANKSEVPKFGVEPQQMKRRKKGGGFNLRKSLAWNRAFFTEEVGLLINLVGTCRLSTEEGGNSLLGDSDCTSDSVDLQAVEENLFKGLPASTPNKGKNIGGGLLSKHDSSARDNVAPASVSARKVLSAHDVNRSGSKRGGCPRPLASSSYPFHLKTLTFCTQKRPANASTTKAAMKESKPPKIPVPKPDPGLIPTTPKRATLGARHSNRNQIAQRAVNVPKSIGLKGSSNSNRSAQYNAKAGPDCKSISSKTSVQPSRRNMVRNMANSLLVKPSSNNLRPPLVTKPNDGFEVIPDLVLPATGTQGSNGCDKSSKVAVTCHQNAECIGGNIQYTQPQATKPTGLRMPSPSLGFFHLSKASAPQSPLQRSTQPCNIPNLRKLGATNPVCDLRPPRAPGKLLKVVNNVTIAGNIRGLNSSRECSVPSPGNSVLHEKMKLNLEVNDLQKVEVKVPHELKSSEPINNQQRLHNILHDYDEQFQEHAEPYKVEKISCKGYTELQMNDNKLLPESASHDQLKKDNDHVMVADVCTKSVDSSGNELENPHFSSQFCSVVQVKGVSQTDDMIEHQQVEDRQYNLSVDHDVFSESQSRDAISYSNRRLHRDWLRSMDDVNDWLRSMHDVNEQFREQPELIKPCFGEADRVSEVENQRLRTNDGILFQETGVSEYSQKYDGTDVSLKIRGRSGSELESSHGRSQFKDIEQLNERAVGVDVVIIKSDMADAQLQSSDCNLSVESYNSNLSTSAVHNQCLMVDGINKHSREQPELQNPRLVEGVLQDCHGLCLNGSVMQVEGVSGTNDSIEKQYVEDNQYNLSVKDHGAISESNSGDAISNNPGTLIVHNNWVSGMHNGNEQSREHSELTKPSTCEADQISHEENQKLRAEDGILIEESRSFEEFHKYDSGNIADVCPKVQGSSESESENSDGSSQLKYIDQASEGAAWSI